MLPDFLETPSQALKMLIAGGMPPTDAEPLLPSRGEMAIWAVSHSAKSDLLR